jgi:long-subunit fatty acid transport protein
MKLSVTLLLLVVVALFAPLTAQAAGSAPSGSLDHGNAEYQRIMDKYGLKRVDSIPEGVTPIYIESPAELKAFMEQLVESRKSGGSVVGVENFNSPYCIATNWGTGQFEVHADVDIANGFVTKLYQVRPILTGVTLGFSLSSPWGVFESTVPSKFVTWRGGGVVNTHLVIESGPILWSTPYSCGATFSAP